MNCALATVLLTASAFSQRSADVVKVTPDTVTRFAFDKANGYTRVQISNQTGPQSDGMLDVIDAIRMNVEQIDVPGYDRALIVRVQSTRGLDSFAAQKIGTAIETYMDMTSVSEFATAAIADIDVGQDLHGKWNTILLLRDHNGTWSFRNLRFTSVQRSTNGEFAILRGKKMARITGKDLVSTLLSPEKLQAILEAGFTLETGKNYLVRTPINKGGAYAVVGDGFQTVYDGEFQVIAAGKAGFTTIPAIYVDGTSIDGQVTTISGKGNTWDIRTGIPANKADKLAQAYGAQAT